MTTKQIIVLSQGSNGTDVTVSGLFWFPITKNPVPQTAGSAWAAVTGVSTGAASAENAAIQAGTIREESWSYSFAIGTPVATIESFLQQKWTVRNTQLNGQGGYQYFGSYYDGTAWGQT